MRKHKKSLIHKEFESFFIEYHSKVKGFAVSILRSKEDAEDITQDIFVKLWDMPHLWRNSKSDAYIFTMVRNHIYNHLRREKFIRDYNSSLTKEITFQTNNSTLDAIRLNETQAIATKTIEEMPERRKEVFTLSRVKGLSNQDIATKLGISIRTVERHLYLALISLKKELQ